MVLAIAVSNPEKIKTNNGAAGYIRSSLAVRNILLVKSSGHRTGITHSSGLEIKKILWSPFGDQLEKYSRQMQIFSRQFV